MERLNGEDWANLVAARPEFADRCNWDKFDPWAWNVLLQQQPQFADKCPWEKISDQDEDKIVWWWMDLLYKQPQFADKCPWEKISVKERNILIKNQPELKKYFDNLKKNAVTVPLHKVVFCQISNYDRQRWFGEELTGRDWSRCLQKNPHFAAEYKCDWDSLDGTDWAYLLAEQPQFADKCQWIKLQDFDWCELLSKQIQFLDKCPVQYLTHWDRILTVHPELAEKCDWKKLNGSSWSHLLSEQPQFADKCDWKKLDSFNWLNLLKAQPQFAEKCDFGKLAISDLTSILSEYPQFISYCPDKIFKKFKTRNWVSLLEGTPIPELFDLCPWDKFSGDDWRRLLAAQPQFADRCSWRKVKTISYPSRSAGELIAAQPQFMDQINLADLADDNWREILIKQPQLASICPWQNFKDTGMGRFEWTLLLIERPEFADRCPWKKLDGEDWFYLLCDRPEFADKCPWGKIKPGDMKQLLEKQPQFASKYNWERFDQNQIEYLIRETAVDVTAYCDFSQLSNNLWAPLLAGLREDSPNADRLAALCPWDKIPAKDLRRLFILQPHFAKYAPPPKAKEKKSEKVQKEDKKVKKSPEKQTVSQNREESIQPDLFDF